jgi:hypothetical protein
MTAQDSSEQRDVDSFLSTIVAAPALTPCPASVASMLS